MRAITLTIAAALLCACANPHFHGAPDAAPIDDYDAYAPLQVVDKVDLLIAVDNSAWMRPMQGMLADAMPFLIGRLVNPNCVDTTNGACTIDGDCASTLGVTARCDVRANGAAGLCFVAGDAKGGAAQCSTIPNTRPEFYPVHDLHVGVVSSSLGGAGSPDTCVPDVGDPTHQDDQGHLLNRTTTGALPNATPSSGVGGNFLAWLPSSDPKNAGAQQPNVTPYNYGQAAQLMSDFGSLITGAGTGGCGFEAALESWYHFLVQPDPWDRISQTSDNPPMNRYDGVDATLLQMRHDFLRPDSLVAIIQLVDEEDSWSDPLWLGGYGWTTVTEYFPGGPGQGAGPRGTSECDVPGGENNPDCTSCAFQGSPKPVSGSLIGADPNCNECAGGATTCPMRGWYTPASLSTPIESADGLNVRFGRQVMRKRYGFDSQHDYHRYFDALRRPTVPDRDHESHAPPYAPERNCTNPLFSAALPDGSDTSPATLCNLAPGPRSSALVFYAVIGGVPNELINDSKGNLKVDLTDADWTSILGKDPDHYDFTGMDPHMIQSLAPRTGLPGPSSAYTLGPDPIHGREFNTLTVGAAIDFQYACTFDLPSPKDCASGAYGLDCDCMALAASAFDGPPLCDPAVRTTQIRGKAYPQSRYQLVAKALGKQSLVASLCAKVTSGDHSAPSYGYNGAMTALVARMTPALQFQ